MSDNITLHKSDCALLLGGYQCTCGFHQRQNKTPTALAAEQPVPTDKDSLTHPGYVIGSHWLETAYSRICAGEAEADVLRDCGWERVDQALRRDAERYRWLRERAWFQDEFEGRYGDSGETVQELDAAIDAAMKEAALRRRET